MDTTAFLRDELRAEADAGFPRLRRAPQTKIIQFLDYFAALSPGERSSEAGAPRPLPAGR